jgi:drug/metabolite transporter (DMT)-like permease
MASMQEKKPLLEHAEAAPMTDGFFATPEAEPLGTAPRLWDRRFWHLAAIGLICIVTIGLRINTAKMATVYDPETGKASEALVFPKPLFLAETYFLGKLLILPFVGWQPSRWPSHLYGKITLMVVFGAMGGMLEYASVLFLPVSVVAMVRVAGLVFFTGFASAYITGKSPMNWQIGLALTIVVAGACVTSVYHVGSTSFETDAMIGLLLVLLSTISDALEQVVCEVIVQEETVDVDVYTFSGVCGLIGSAFMGIVLCVAQVFPGDDNGVLEDSVETLGQLSSSWGLALLIAATVVLCLGEMISAAALAKYYGVTTKEALLSFRIVAAWLFAVIIYYAWGDYGFGEAVTWEGLAYKSLGGFLIVGGVFFYVHVRREAEERLGKVDKSSDTEP